MKKRTFDTVVNGETVTLAVVKPTLAQENDANKIYVKKKIKLLNLPKEERPFPQNSVRVKLKESGIWSEEQDKELAEVDARIAILEKILETGEREEDGVAIKLKKLEGRKVALELMVIRFAKFNMLTEIEQFARDITLERIAEREQLDYLVSVCTLDKDNRKYFKNLEDYQARQYDQDAIDARAALENHLADNQKDWREDLIEYKFLREYKYVDDKYRLIDKDGHLCDVDFRRINEDGLYIDDNGNVIEEVPSEVGVFLDDEVE